MKIKTTFVIVLALVMTLSLAYQRTNAASKNTNSGTFKIAVVSVRDVFEKCKRNEDYRKKAESEQNRILAELDKLSKEIDAATAGLKTLKPDSDDYMNQAKEIFQMQASLQAQQKFYKQQFGAKDKNWTEQLYKDILGATADVAEKKEIALVLEKDEIDFPTPSSNELMLSIRTHKILYAGGCEDITEQVMELVDKKM